MARYPERFLPPGQVEPLAASPRADTDPANTARSHAPRLMYLDGLRGFAALYVVLFHWQTHLRDSFGINANTMFPAWLRFLLGFAAHGHAAVCVFIVLSGYVLMLPIASSGCRNLRGGVPGFIKRRARRILPTYYAALLLFSSLLLLSQHMPASNGRFQRNLSAVSFWQHVFLVHNLSADYWFTIDAPMWSLATEWQIYFVFALVLFPLYRRVGWLLTLLFAVVVSLLPHLVLPADRNLDQAAPWFIALFVMGMGAALRSQSVRSERNAPWGAVSGSAFVIFLLLDIPLAQPVWLRNVVADNLWLPDLFCGAAAAALLVACTEALRQSSPESPHGFWLRLFQSRFLISIGTFSYSLYLVHQPIIGLMVASLHWKKLPLSPVGVALLSFALLPAIVVLSYGFYLLFERPFMGDSPFVWVKRLVPAGAASEK